MTSTARWLSSLGSLLTGVGLVLVIVACTAFLGVRYWLWPQADRFRDAIVAQIERGLGRPISIGAIETGWDGVRPIVRLIGVQVSEANGAPAITLPSVTTVISWRSLPAREPRVASLRITSADLTVVRHEDGAISVAGFPLGSATPAVAGPAAGDGGFVALLLAQQRIDVVDARIRWIDRRGEFPELVFERAQLALVNSGRAHRLSVLADAGALAQGLDLRADFIRMPDAAPTDWRQWRGDFYLRTAALQLDALRRFAEVPAALHSGRVDAQAWLSLFEGRVRELAGSVVGSDLVLGAESGELRIGQAALTARAVPAADGFRVTVSEARLSEEGGLSLASAGDATLELAADGGLRALRATLERFNLDRAASVLARAPWSLPQDAQAWVERLEPRGRVDRLSVRWRAAAVPGGEPQFGLAAGFDRLRLVAQPPVSGARLGVPGVEALAGQIEFDNRGGRLSLRDSTPRFRFPGLLADETIALETIGGELRWSRTPSDEGPARLEVEIDRVRFANADAEVEVSGRWQRAGAGSGSVDLKGHIARANAARLFRYLPARIGPQTRDWIERAVAAGEARGAELVLRGALQDFPFRDPAQGEFRVNAPVVDLQLAYAPGWPALQAVRGVVVFERGGMDIRAESGKVFDVRLGATRATIEDFRQPLLMIRGSGLGLAQDMVRFVNESPIAARIDQFTVDTRVSGSARLDLELALDLGDMARSRVNGTVALRDSEVVVDRTLPSFSGVSGMLEFTGEGFALREMSGTMLGGPISVSARTLAPGQIRIDARGQIDAAGMRQVIDNAVTRKLSGRAAYRASIETRNRASRVRIESNLVGLSSTLPAPFAKRADDAVALVVETRPQQPSRADARPAFDTIEASVGEAIRLVLERRREAQSDKLRVHRGVFTVKVDPVLPQSGFAVLMDVPFIDLDTWHGLLADARVENVAPATRADFEEGFSLLPTLVSAWSRVVRVGNRELHDVAFGATREGARWRANVAAEELNGYFSWEEALPGQPSGTLSARFNRLAIPKSRVEEVESLLSSSPEILPAIDVAAENLVLGEVELGALELVAENRGKGDAAAWVISRLKLENPDATLRASGRWAFAGAGVGRATSLKFELELRNSGGLIARFGVPGALRGAPGVMSGEVAWSGVPFSIHYPSLSGNLVLAIRQGQFLKVEPGIAKLIGVLSLQSLPKRLTFDFRDVFAEGFLFDAIRGNARIESGVAHTDNLTMKGVQAQVRIRGAVDLARETQDLMVDVRPELNAGLASLAYAALANPALGLGSFLAQMVLRKPLTELFAYQIEVKGSWSDPDVVQKKREPVTSIQDTP